MSRGMVEDSQSTLTTANVSINRKVSSTRGLADDSRLSINNGDRTRRGDVSPSRDTERTRLLSTASNERTRLMSFHEQSISVINSMMLSGEWGKEEEEEEGFGTVFGAIFILMNSILGASILVLPFSYGQTGVITAVIMELFVVFIGYIAHVILADAVDRYNGKNYQDLLGRICGAKVQLAAQVLLSLYFFTLCAATHITMGDQGIKLCEFAAGINDTSMSAHGGEYWYCERYVVIPGMSMVLIFPLLWFRTMSGFSYVSVFSVLSVFYIVAAVVIDYFHLDNVIDDQVIAPDVGIMPIMHYLPIFILGFQCHICSVPLYYELKDRSIAKYSVVILVASLLVAFCYFSTGIVGLYTFGRDVHSDVLLSYSSTDMLMTLARAAIAVSVIMSYPIFLFLGRGGIDDCIIQAADKMGRRVSPHSEPRRVLTIVAWHLLALGLSLTTSSLERVLALVGSIGSLFMLVFPGYIILVEGRRGNWGFRVAGGSLLVLGLFVFGWTVVSNLYTILTT